ncbi:MAG: hypothetical protein F4053_10220, partial [Proteobacteria bacterium]|nr:hypothetical protein [Pseudomonadota bacterium]
YYEIAGQGRRDLYISRDYRAAFEMTLLRMLAFRPVSGQEPQSQEKSRTAQAGVNKGAAGTSAVRGRPSDTSAGGSEPYGTSAARGKSTGPAEDQRDAQPPKPEVNVPDSDNWHEFISEARITGAPRQLAEHCAIKESTADRLALVLASDNAHLNTDRVRTRLLEELRKQFSGRVSVKIEVGEPPAATPAQIRAKGESERMRKARASIESDPVVKTLQTEFDAVLEVDSIRPLESEQA